MFIKIRGCVSKNGDFRRKMDFQLIFTCVRRWSRCRKLNRMQISCTSKRHMCRRDVSRVNAFTYVTAWRDVE